MSGLSRPVPPCHRLTGSPACLRPGRPTGQRRLFEARRPPGRNQTRAVRAGSSAARSAVCAASMTSASVAGGERNGEWEESISTTLVGRAETASISRTMRRCSAGRTALSLAAPVRRLCAARRAGSPRSHAPRTLPRRRRRLSHHPSCLCVAAAVELHDPQPSRVSVRTRLQESRRRPGPAAPEDEDSAEIALRAVLATQCATVRPFLSPLGESKALDAVSAGKWALGEVRCLPVPVPARRKAGAKPLLPGGGRRVRAADVAQGGVRQPRPAAERTGPGRICGVRAGAAAPGLEQPRCLRLTLAPPVQPACPPLDRPDWGAAEEEVLTALSRDRPPRGTPGGAGAGPGRRVEAAHRAPCRSEAAREDAIEVQDDGRVKLNVAGPGALGESTSLTWLRKRVEKALPKIDLPDLPRLRRLRPGGPCPAPPARPGGPGTG